jgi:phosphoglycolate phosphatase
MNKKAIIFDLDGTLLNTLHDIAWCMNAALQEIGAPGHPAENYRRFVGRGLDMLAHDVLPATMRDKATVERAVAIMRRFYAERWSHATRPYDGIQEMLSALRKRRIRCAVYSNKAHDFTVKIVNH